MPNGKPNILVIWGDDIGISNLSCYSDGLMGYRTPNIDRIANEGMRFTDSYGEQSCTAGRAAFISGQSVYRTGMSKVGVPGAPIGWAAEDPTIAELLKPLGYATGQFGKNHFGDLNKYLPTVHGFDEFFGNLYHLNAEEEPEQFDYPHKDQFPKLHDFALPRGVLKCTATDEMSQEPDDPKYGPVGKQTIEDTGPLDTKRMETIDDETTGACIDYIKRQHEAGTPFFVWMNTTHMHLYTHTKPESRGQAGLWQSGYHDTMIDHDRNVGHLLDCLDELDIADDTIVVYSTDNGPHRNSWPDAGTTPFRSEKDTNWEGAFRVPEMIRWPGKIPAGAGVQRDRPAPRLATHISGRCRRSRRHRKAEEGTQGRGRRKHRIQGPHRRIQLAALPDRRGRHQPPARLLLLLRRRRPRRHALRELESRVHGAALPGYAADLGGTFHDAAGAEVVQPANRSV
jgi:arylsulfatase A-like enzyme